MDSIAPTAWYRSGFRRSGIRVQPRLALAIILSVSSLLGAAWALRVPLLQQPDEIVHLDYALDLARAGHLLTARDRPVETAPLGQTNPYTAYLEGHTGFGVMVHRSLVKAPAGYGSPAFFRALDAGAPHLTDTTPTRAPYLLAYYPFGYYAVLAIFLRLLQDLGVGLAEMVFAARLLSVAMTTCALALGHQVMRLLGVAPGRALAIVAIAAIMPLTTFVASSVQPDNMSGLLLYLAVYSALRARGTASPGWRWALGWSAGLLLVTKYQFFLVTVIPVFLFMVSSSGSQRVHPWPGRFAMVSPSLALGVVQAWVAWGGAPAVISQNHAMRWNYSAINVATHQGLATLVGYVGNTALAAFRDFYVFGGLTFDTYWRVFGWADTPIIIVNPEVSALAYLAFGLAALAVTGATVATAVNVGRTLLLAARRRHGRLAADVAFANPLVNAYLCFTVFMISLYILTGDSFAAQGRNWAPFVLPSLWLMTTAVSAAQSRLRMARLASIVLSLLAAYVLLSATFALPSISSRYYGNGRQPGDAIISRLHPLSQTTTFHIDYAFASDLEPGIKSRSVPAGGLFAVGGWAVDQRVQSNARTVVATLDGHTDFQTVYGDDSVEAAQRLGQRYRRSGFDLIIPSEALTPGTHRLTFKVVSANGMNYYSPTDAVDFQVASLPTPGPVGS